MIKQNTKVTEKGSSHWNVTNVFFVGRLLGKNTWQESKSQTWHVHVKM